MLTDGLGLLGGTLIHRRVMRALPYAAFYLLRRSMKMSAYIKQFDENMSLKRCEYANPAHNYAA